MNEFRRQALWTSLIGLFLVGSLASCSADIPEQKASLLNVKSPSPEAQKIIDESTKALLKSVESLNEIAQAPAKSKSEPKDSDSDGLTDDEEITLGTNINSHDTDGDGFSDSTEVRKNYDPLKAYVAPIAAPTEKQVYREPEPVAPIAAPVVKPLYGEAEQRYVAPQIEASGCHPNYSGACVPIASDVDCEGGSGNGPAYISGPVYVRGTDIYGLDGGVKDGVGCEK